MRTHPSRCRMYGCLVLTRLFVSQVSTPMTEGRECKSELMLRPDDITDAIMYALTCSANCVPEDIVLRLVLPADK